MLVRESESNRVETNCHMSVLLWSWFDDGNLGEEYIKIELTNEDIFFWYLIFKVDLLKFMRVIHERKSWVSLFTLILYFNVMNGRCSWARKVGQRIWGLGPWMIYVPRRVGKLVQVSSAVRHGMFLFCWNLFVTILSLFITPSVLKCSVHLVIWHKY